MKYRHKLQVRIAAEKAAARNEVDAREVERLEREAWKPFRRAEKLARRSGVVEFFECVEKPDARIAQPSAQAEAQRIFDILFCDDDRIF